MENNGLDMAIDIGTGYFHLISFALFFFDFPFVDPSAIVPGNRGSGHR